MARAFDWQSKGQEFDSPNLHNAPRIAQKTTQRYGWFFASHVDMIRKKLIAKDDNVKIHNLKENSAANKLIKGFNSSINKN